MINRYTMLVIIYLVEVAFLIGLYFFFKWFVSKPPRNEKLMKSWEKKEKSFKWTLEHFWVIIIIWIIAMIQITRVILKVFK